MKKIYQIVLSLAVLCFCGMGISRAAALPSEPQAEKQTVPVVQTASQAEVAPQLNNSSQVGLVPQAEVTAQSELLPEPEESSQPEISLLPQEKPKRYLGNLSGSFETNTIYYQNDSKTGAVAPPDNYGSNNYLKLDYQYKRLTIGLQAEWYPQVLDGYEKALNGFGIPEKYIMWTDRNYSITVGDFYEQFGSGLVLRAWEDRFLGFNNSLGGGRVTFNIKNLIQGKVLFGLPRYYMESRYYPDFGGTQVAAGDLSFSLSNAIGLQDHSLSIEGSLVNRHENRHPEFYTEEYLGFKLPRNVLSYSARLNYEYKGWMAKFEYVGKGKDVFTSLSTMEQELSRGDAQVIELGYSGDGFAVTGTFRRLKNMQDLMFRTAEQPLAGNTINYVPALTPQHSYALATLDPYTPNIFGEMGGQIDAFYFFKRGSAIGGKRGMTIHANFSMYYSLDGAMVQPGKHFLYREFTFDIDKSWNKKLRTILFVSLQKGAFHDPNQSVDQNVFVGDITYKFTPKFSVRAELQYLYTPDAPEGDWMAAVLDMNFAPNWSVYGSWTYNHGGEKINYYSAGASFTHSFIRVALSYGRNKAGFVCSGGVCRPMPAYTGGNLQMTLTF